MIQETAAWSGRNAALVRGARRGGNGDVIEIADQSSISGAPMVGILKKAHQLCLRGRGLPCTITSQRMLSGRQRDALHKLKGHVVQEKRFFVLGVTNRLDKPAALAQKALGNAQRTVVVWALVRDFR